jgi:large subunit ribosomal protein L29
MKPNEIRDMNDDALVAKGLELREQLFRLRFKHALGNTDVVKSIKDARKDFARVKN